MEPGEAFSLFEFMRPEERTRILAQLPPAESAKLLVMMSVEDRAATFDAMTPEQKATAEVSHCAQRLAVLCVWLCIVPHCDQCITVR